MVLPEDELKIYRPDIADHLTDTNQQLKKWINRWRPVIDHSMKRVKELAKENSIPIWRHYTSEKPTKTVVKRHISTRANKQPRKYANNPLTNVFTILKKKRSTSRPKPIQKPAHKPNRLLTNMLISKGFGRSHSKVGTVQTVEQQHIDDRFGDGPNK